MVPYNYIFSAIFFRQVFIALSGDLGSGKTTFIQGLAYGLGIKKRIISPTFIILRTYKLPEYNFYHIDLYKGNFDSHSLTELGLTEIIENKKDVVAVEWSEKMKDFLPANRWEIKFENIGEDRREINISRIND